MKTNANTTAPLFTAAAFEAEAAIMASAVFPAAAVSRTVDLSFPFRKEFPAYVEIGGQDAPRWIKKTSDVKYTVDAENSVVYVTMPRSLAVRRKFIAAA